MLGRPGRKPSRWIGAGVITALAVGVGVALWSTRPPSARVPDPGAIAAGEDPVARSLETLPPDSTAIKTRWLDDVTGVFYDDLDPARRETFVRFANARFCDCGCGYTLAGCKASDMECGNSGLALEALLDSLRSGRSPSLDGIRERPDGD
jgi:hypothetical protein